MLSIILAKQRAELDRTCLFCLPRASKMGLTSRTNTFSFESASRPNLEARRATMLMLMSLTIESKSLRCLMMLTTILGSYRRTRPSQQVTNIPMSLTHSFLMEAFCFQSVSSMHDKKGHIPSPLKTSPIQSSSSIPICCMLQSPTMFNTPTIFSFLYISTRQHFCRPLPSMTP